MDDDGLRHQINTSSASYMLLRVCVCDECTCAMRVIKSSYNECAYDLISIFVNHLMNCDWNIRATLCAVWLLIPKPLHLHAHIPLMFAAPKRRSQHMIWINIYSFSFCITQKKNKHKYAMHDRMNWHFCVSCDIIVIVVGDDVEAIAAFFKFAYQSRKLSVEFACNVSFRQIWMLDVRTC